MTQVEKRILELEFDNKNFEANVRGTIDSLSELEERLQLKGAGTAFDNLENNSKKVKFQGIRDAISNLAGKFSSFRQSASDDITSVEQAGSRFSFRNILTGVSSVASAFLSMTRSSRSDMSQLQAAEERFTMQSMASAIENISSKFSMLGIVGITVLQDITNAALNAGKSLINNILNPITEGGKKRALAIENARFTLQGLIDESKEGAGTIDAIMDAASDSVNGTAYAYNDAASAAAQFAATGLRAEGLKDVLKGVAGTAATVNAEYSDISHIFTTVAGNGRLMTEQLNQFSYRGLNAAATLKDEFNAVLNGTSNLSAEVQQNIKDVVQYGIDNVKNFTGSMEEISEADLRALVSAGKVNFGIFSSIMATTFGDHAKDANKTFTGSMANIRAALARTGEMFYAPFVKQGGELVQFLNSVRTAINAFNKALKPFATFVTDAANGMIASLTPLMGTVEAFFRELEGWHVISALRFPLESLGKILTTVGEAFAEVFNVAQPGQEVLRGIAIEMRKFLRELTVSDETLANIKTVATAVFTVFRMLSDAIGAAVRVVLEILPAFQPLVDLFTRIILKVSDLVMQFDRFERQTEGIATIADVISSVLTGLIKDITILANAVVDFFGDLTKGIAEGAENLNLFQRLGDKLGQIFDDIRQSGGLANMIIDGFSNALEKLNEILGPLLDKLGELSSHLGTKIFEVLDEGINNLTFDRLLNIIGLFMAGGFLASFQSAMSTLSSGITGIADSVSTALGTLITPLQALFGTLEEAETLSPEKLIKLAAAIAILAASLFLLATLDPGELQRALVGLGAAMVELGIFTRAMGLTMNSVTDLKSFGMFTASIIALSTALLLLATAIRALGKLDYDELIRGIVGLASAMAILVNGFKALSRGMERDISKVASSCLVLAAALAVLVIPVKALAKLDIRSLAKGVGGLGAMLAELTLFMNNLQMTALNPKLAASLIEVSIALVALAGAAKIFAGMSLGELGKAGVSIGALMTALVLFNNTLKGNNLIGVASQMILVAGAIAALGGAAKIFASMSLDELAKGGVSIGALMTAMVVFTRTIKTTDILQAGAAMVLLSGSLLVMSQAVKALAAIRLENLIASVGALAVVMATMVIAANFAEKSIKGMLALNAIVPVLGMLALALGTLANVPIPGLIAAILALAATIGVFVAAAMLLEPHALALAAFAGTMLAMGVALGVAGAGIGIAAMGIATLAGAIAAGGMTIIAVMSELFRQLPGWASGLAQFFVNLLGGLAENAAKLGEALVALGMMLIDTMVQLIPAAVNAIWQFVNAMVTSLVENVPVLVGQLLEFLTAILTTIADNLPSLIEAGMRVIMGLLQGLEQNLPQLVDEAFKIVISFLNGLAEAIRANHAALYEAAWNLITAIVEALVDGVVMIVQAGADLIGSFFQAIADFDPVGKIAEIAQQIVDGFVQAFLDLGAAAADAVGGFFGGIVDTACDFLGIASPSRVFADIGENTGLGFIEGLEGTSEGAQNAGAKWASDFTSSFEKKAKNGEKTGKELGEAVLDGLKSNAKDYKATGDESVKDYIEAIKASNNAAKQSGEEVTGNAIQGLASNANDYITIASTQATSFVENIRNKFTSAKVAGTTVTANAVTGLGSNYPQYGSTGATNANNFIDTIRSRWQAAYNAGSYITTGAKDGTGSNIAQYAVTAAANASNFVSGIWNKWSDAFGAGQHIGNKGREGAGSVSMYGAGENAGQGFINGLAGKGWAVYNAARELASNALQGMLDRLREQSPSRETMQIGAYFTQGFAIGIASDTAKVVSAAEKLASESMDALNGAITVLSAAFEDNDFSLEPTITPVVDLANVERASLAVDKMFADSGALRSLDSRVQAAAFGWDLMNSPAQVEKVAQPTIVNQKFEQNNYSPKALDELEIYRRTKSVYASAKSSVSFQDGGVIYHAQ